MRAIPAVAATVGVWALIILLVRAGAWSLGMELDDAGKAMTLYLACSLGLTAGFGVGVLS